MVVNYIVGIDKKVDAVSAMLNSFVESGSIVAEEVIKIDELIDISFKNQLAVLNDNLLELRNQRILFGAMRNIKNTTKIMKKSLETANKRKENPITAEKCLAIMPYIKDLGRVLDNFLEYRVEKAMQKTKLFEKIEKSSRILHKKAKNSGFYRLFIDEELVDKKEMEKFINDLNSELRLNADIDEDLFESTD